MLLNLIGQFHGPRDSGRQPSIDPSIAEVLQDHRELVDSCFEGMQAYYWSVGL